MAKPQKNIIAKTQRRRAASAKGTGKRSAGNTHDALIGAAVKIFALKGYEGTTVQEIASAAGVNLSLISYHFGGKQALYQECLEKFGEARLAKVRQLLQPSGNFEEFRIRLKIFANEFFEANIQNIDLATMVHREVESGIENAPDTFQRTFLVVFQTLIEYFESAKKRKIIRKDLNPFFAAGTMFGAMVHSITHDHVTQKIFGKTLNDAAHRQLMCDQLMIFYVDSLHPENWSRKT